MWLTAPTYQPEGREQGALCAPVMPVMAEDIMIMTDNDCISFHFIHFVKHKNRSLNHSGDLQDKEQIYIADSHSGNGTIVQQWYCHILFFTL